MFTQNALVAETEKLQKFAYRLTRNKSDAEDLVQSTCLRAIEKMHYFTEGTNLFSWTSKIMYNIFVSGYRRKTKFETQYDPEPYLEKISMEPTQHINAEVADVKRAMAKLGKKHREILVLICAQGRKYDEVSKMLQIPIGTVRSRLSRARIELQDIMDTPSPIKMIQAIPCPKPANANLPAAPGYLVARARSIAAASTISIR